MIRSDIHMHSSFSIDSETEMEEMVKASIDKGLEYICFTDHQDKNCYMDDLEFQFETGLYKKRIEQLREKNQKIIKIGFGVEIGLMPEEPEFCNNYPKQWDFDYVIGSVHFVNYKDPYYKEFFQQYKSDHDAYRHYIEVTLQNVRAYSDFDSLGHLDYVVRYGENREKAYLEHDYSDITDEILKILIQRGQGLEVNTAGLKYGLPFAHPHTKILKRYQELGGKIITIGSDAHKPEHIAYNFSIIEAYLKELGFSYYTTFVERRPQFIKIE